MAKYFELEDDLWSAGRWYLNRLCDRNGTELDSREFQYGKPVDLGPPVKAKLWKDGTALAAQPPLKVLLDPKRSGLPLDWTFTNADMPVVTSAVASLLSSIAAQDIQRIPVVVESRDAAYEIINVVSVVDCIDVERSDVQWFEVGNRVRPDLAGQPEVVRKLVVDPTRVGDHHLFRIVGWKVVIVASERVKIAFEKARVTGVKFRQVSP